MKRTKNVKVEFAVDIMYIHTLLGDRFSANVHTFHQDYSVDLSQMKETCSGLLFSKQARLVAESALRIAGNNNEEQHPFFFAEKTENGQTTCHVRYRGIVKRDVTDSKKQAIKQTIENKGVSNNETERQARELFIKTVFSSNAVDFDGYKILPLISGRKAKYYRNENLGKEPFEDGFCLSELKRTCFIFEKDNKFYLSVSSEIKDIDLFLSKSVFKKGFTINELLLASLNTKQQENILEIKRFLERIANAKYNENN